MEKDLITTQTLSDMFQFGIQKEEQKQENLTYVIYLRKSTDEDNKQVRSIDDQKKACIDFANKNKLKYHPDIIEERKSAKESGKRPEFTKMLKDLNNGLYDGIICWHPDRLSRNMKEAGEVIDMLDTKYIKDLKFASFTFTNDSSGKMALGITFVLSKVYSDNLSDNVKRGTYRRTDEGKVMGHVEHGYIKDKLGFRRPDGENFKLIKSIFEMRLRGNTLQEIAVNFNLKREWAGNKSSKVIPQFRKQEVAKILAKSVYAGVYTYGKHKDVINLTELYDFEPMISPSEFIQLNPKSINKKAKKAFERMDKVGRKADLLNGCVFCNYCTMPMSAGITPRKFRSHTKNYYYFRCEEIGCKNKGKSTRAHIVLDYVCTYIEERFKATTESWLHYQREAKKDYEELRRKLIGDLAILTTNHTNLLKTQNNIKEEIIRLSQKEENDYLRTSFEKDFEINKIELEDLELKIAECKEKTSQKLKILDQKDFLEQMQNIPNFIRQRRDMGMLDKVIRKIFLNFTVTGKEVVKSTLSSPFDTILETKVSSSVFIVPS